MSIRQNIIALRAKYNLTQLELAKIAGVSRGAVSQWEGGFSEPRMGAIQRIADHFGISKSSIIEDGGMYGAVSPSGMVDMPLYGSIAAGTPIDMMEADGTCPVPAVVAGALDIADALPGRSVQLTYYRDQEQFDLFGREPGEPYGQANANTRMTADALRCQGIDVSFAYPDDSDNIYHGAKS